MHTVTSHSYIFCVDLVKTIQEQHPILFVVLKPEAPDVASFHADAGSSKPVVMRSFVTCYSEVKILSSVTNKHFGGVHRISVLTKIHPLVLASISNSRSLSYITMRPAPCIRMVPA